MRQLYDELNEQGVVIATAIKLLPGMTLTQGHRWVPHQPDLETYKAKSKQNIESYRDKQCFKSIEYGGYTWQADSRSQELLSNTINLVSSGAMPCPPVWRTEDNQDVPVDLNYLKNIAGIIATQTFQAYQKSWQLKQQVDDCTSIQQLNNISW